MNFTFCDSSGNSVVSDVSFDFIAYVEDSLIVDPRIVDGMGDRMVMCGCNVCGGNKLAQFGEIIVVEYFKSSGEKFSKTFHGSESYIIQSALHELSRAKECKTL